MLKLSKKQQGLRMVSVVLSENGSILRFKYNIETTKFWILKVERFKTFCEHSQVKTEEGKKNSVMYSYPYG